MIDETAEEKAEDRNLIGVNQMPVIVAVLGITVIISLIISYDLIRTTWFFGDIAYGKPDLTNTPECENNQENFLLVGNGIFPIQLLDFDDDSRETTHTIPGYPLQPWRE